MAVFGISEPVVRVLAFGAIFLGLALLEILHPRLERPEMQAALKARRWVTNLALLVASSLLLRVVFPLAAVGTALWAEARGLGLLPAIGLDGVVAGVIAFLVLDFAIWLEHVASHRFALLWRFHRMHHADNGFDLTTALRFHPGEILLSMLWKAAIVIALGAPPLAVLIFEIVLNGAAMFNHANIRLPPRLDAVLRRVVVTPDMHRVHHSMVPRETHSNFGFSLSVWDRLFSTYVAQPERGHEGMEIGLPAYRGTQTSGFWWALTLPFRRQ
ncbi:sterol desaturase family protein [Rhizobium sp. TRM95111]|uniref:sterol desaturase family protein n=1 Tax=Rhizobium alarense TaxID=2846851 RepID=UPI001F1E113C|nr:sterol desaturase family protein [Rhizobium alarense]MCF3641980.1 sterol desaturase family protein [Rhizobium alarense]